MDRITRNHPLVSFTELLDGDLKPETVVATFLAILELCKRGSVTLSQAETFGEIDIARVEGAPAFQAYLDLQNYDDELQHLEHKYGLPDGRLYLALADGAPAGSRFR